MISYLKGKLVDSGRGEVTIFTPGGVGYRVFVSPPAASKYRVGDELELYTHLAVRENALDLFGFGSKEEIDLFTQFLTVSGVGPKIALHLCSLGSVPEITGAISRGDLNYLTGVSGIGRKTAERLVVELKGKMGQISSPGDALSDGAAGDAIAGLVAMGYGAQAARDAVKKINSPGKTSQELIKEALRII